MSVRIYCCGGAGTNVGKQIKDLDLDVCYVDSSDANLRDVKHDQIYLIEDQEGAGKNRSITYNNFKDVVGDVLIKFRPSTDINIVVSSLTGGSGSVQGPLLVKELIQGGFPTIVIGIDSRSSTIELTNAVNTLKTYKSISNQIKKSISLFHVENTSRREADKQSTSFISLIALLVNRQKTSEFDVTDLRNFINFDTVTNNSYDVSVLEVNPNEQVFPEKGTSVVSSILVTSDVDTSIEPVVPEYLATCVVTDPEYNMEDLRIDNLLGKLSIIIDEFETQIKELADTKKINKVKELVVESNTDDGFMVL